MRLATVLTPTSEHNLRLAAQCGVTDLVYRYPGPTLDDLMAIQARCQSFGLRLAAIEGYLPLENIKLGKDDGSELQALRTLIAHMGAAGVPVLCYNFMAGTDWVRTKLDVAERGGALVSAFHLADAERAILLGHDSSEAHVVERDQSERDQSERDQSERDQAEHDERVTADQLWQRLERLLQDLIPLAEQSGVRLAMHPDDPPLAELFGKARIMNCVESFERLVNLVPSPSNGICFCQGAFAEMGVDIPATIRRLGAWIRYVHFRDVRGAADSFRETFHDNGPTDMAAAMRAYREIGFDGPLRPDHVPQLAGEENGEPGYTMLGRLFAYGYIRGLMQASEVSL